MHITILFLQRAGSQDAAKPGLSGGLRTLGGLPELHLSTQHHRFRTATHILAHADGKHAGVASSPTLDVRRDGAPLAMLSPK